MRLLANTFPWNFEVLQLWKLGCWTEIEDIMGGLQEQQLRKAEIKFLSKLRF